MSMLTRLGNGLYTGDKSIDFIGRRRTWYLIAAVLLLLAIGVTALRGGFVFGIEFRGGSEFRVSQASLVVEDPSAATQLATASPSRNGMVGVDADGREQPNLRELAHTLGKATGIVSDTRLTHATPGAFLAHVPYRGAEDTIAEQIVASTVDVALSGGRRHFHAGEGGRDDERDLLDEARSAGFDVVATADELTAAGPRVLGLFSDGGMPNAMVTADQPEVPTLAAMASAALTRLEDDPDGFLLVVEAGQIDWAAHANDAGWMLAELKRFDEALGVLLSYAEAHNDTLLVVTADHETGGFGIASSDAMPAEPVNLPGLDAPWNPHGSPVDAAVLTRLEQQPISVFDLFGELGALDEAEQTPEALAALVDEHWGLVLTPEAAARVLADGPMPAREGFFGTGGSLRTSPTPTLPRP